MTTASQCTHELIHFSATLAVSGSSSTATKEARWLPSVPESVSRVKVQSNQRFWEFHLKAEQVSPSQPGRPRQRDSVSCSSTVGSSSLMGVYLRVGPRVFHTYWDPSVNVTTTAMMMVMSMKTWSRHQSSV